MDPNLLHLPESKQNELAEIVKIIREIANPAKIILFGSHTSDNWVEDEYVEKGATYSYISDYDILVVIQSGGQDKEHEIASKIESRTLKYKNDVSPIVHDIDYVNKGLEDGQFFFRDIVKAGIVLYDDGMFKFSSPNPLTKEQEKKRAEYYKEKYIDSAQRFFRITKTSFKEALDLGEPLNEVIFLLHQTTERFYGGVLLVYTGYKPKSHKLKVYRKYSKHISEELNRVFKYPIDDPEEFRLFDLLHKSYLDSRYQDGYFIDKADLETLIKKVENLGSVSIKLCQERIDSLGN